MAQLHARYPDNTPGAYYVDRSCIDCNKCRQVAPAHFAAHEGGFSFVHAQPAGPLEEASCLDALSRCPVGAIGRDGLAPGPTPMRRLMPDLWSCGHPSALTDEASSYLLVRPEGNVLVDVPDFHPALIPQLEALGDLRYIFITHEDTIGEVELFQAHFGAEVIMHAAEAHRLPLGADRPFEASFQLFDDLTVLHTPGHTSGSSCLLWQRRGGLLFTGDHLLPVGDTLMPVRFDWTSDWDRQLAEARGLLDLAWGHAFAAHGAEALPLGFMPQGRARLAEALAESER